MNNLVAPTVPKQRVTRESRRPFGSHRQKLAYENRLGYHRHWFNDEPGRLIDAADAGYAHVVDKEGQKVCRPVGIAAAGGVLMGYLMEIPEEWYKEDMDKEQSRVNEMDQAIRQGAVAGAPGKDGRYIPEARGIKIQEGKR